MASFRNLPISRKLTLIIMAINGAALLLAGTTLAIYEHASNRRAMERDFAILTDIFDDNVAAGLAFNDPASIEQTLKTLSAHQHIVAAGVYDRQGQLVAQYRRDGANDRITFPTAPLTGQRFHADRLDTFKDIELAGETIGVVYVGADLGELYEHTWFHAGILTALLVACSLMALILSARFQHIVSGPIVDLARTVATVATEKNYAVRAHKQSDDELGRLIDGFNEMLAQIQARDAALQRAHDGLEERVAARTAELEQAQEQSAEERERLNFIFESVSVGINLRRVQPDGRETRLINAAHLRIIGLTREQMDEPDALRRISHPEDYQRQVPLNRQLDARQIDRFSLEKRYLHADGRTTWVTGAIQRRDLPDGSYEELSTVVDISDLKHAQEDSAWQQARFKFIFEAVPVGISLVAVDDTNTHLVNPAHERITGVSARESSAPKAFERVSHPDDYRRQMEVSKPFVRGETDHYSIEKRYLHPDGHAVWALLTSRKFSDSTGAQQSVTTLVDITEQKATEAQLANSLSVLHATIESTADGILVVNQQGRLTTSNRKFAEMWRIPPEVIASGDDKQVMGSVLGDLKDPEGFVRKVRELYGAADASSFDAVEFKDGRVFERYSQVQRIEGVAAGRVWCFRDVTERKLAEAKLVETHKQLLATSRQAGMAEIATGVLHNVGNVLNSVNVSATLVMDRVRGSKMVQVRKLGGLLEEHAADLADFLTNDPKGCRIPRYLLSLSEDLALEQGALVEELGHLRKNIEHIKEIVAMQQNYAKVSGVTESVALIELMEDALRINEGSLSHHGLKVLRDYVAKPTLALDRHKVMQIFVNLIRNAKHACDDSRRPDKQITLRITREGDRVRVAVIDNGVGISPENLTRIFAHGFTTRKTGHGFGLHSGALAAKELGGSLIAQSDGPGLGATFILEVPDRSWVGAI